MTREEIARLREANETYPKNSMQPIQAGLVSALLDAAERGLGCRCSCERDGNALAEPLVLGLLALAEKERS